ncbi:MAG: hypothetical protein DRN26_00925 [Thermoplasmata archaeon]|nr:MAG: hypothetical protein DRN26_00925 [Thermoplasmata archaeon]
MRVIYLRDELGIFIGGIGGQGAILAGNIIGRIVVEYRGLYATMEAAYTSQTMGGPSKAEVKISRVPIVSPFLERIDYLVALHMWPLKSEKVLSLLSNDSVIIYNSDVLQERPKGAPGKEIIGIPMTSIANDVNNPRAVNMVALGVLTKYIGDFISLEDIERLLKELFNEKIAESNIRALRAGYAYKI